MLTLYLGALAFGGTLLIASLVLGASDKDLDKSTDHHLDKDAHLGDGFAWLPVASLRFWTFLLAFGGAAGTALTYAGGVSRAVVAVIAVAVGWACGVGMVAVMRTVRKGSVGSELSPRDLRGETAEVVVAVARGTVGKVRVSAKGRIHDLIAETEDDATFAAGSKVMILGEGAEGRVQVTRA
jgi:membrane protein implicated in regulation of membrane protease activity